MSIYKRCRRHGAEAEKRQAGRSRKWQAGVHARDKRQGRKRERGRKGRKTGRQAVQQCAVCVCVYRCAVWRTDRKGVWGKGAHVAEETLSMCSV